MSYGFKSIDPATTTSDSFEASDSSSRTEQRTRFQLSGFGIQQPAVHNEDQLSAVGFGPDTNAGGFEPGDFEISTTQSIDLNEHFSAGYHGELPMQTPTAEPWTPLSLHSDQYGRHTSEGKCVHLISPYKSNAMKDPGW